MNAPGGIDGPIGWRTVVSILSPAFAVLAFVAVGLFALTKFYLADRDAILDGHDSVEASLRADIERLRVEVRRLDDHSRSRRDATAADLYALIAENKRFADVLNAEARSAVEALKAFDSIVETQLTRLNRNGNEADVRLGVLENSMALRLFRKPIGAEPAGP